LPSFFTVLRAPLLVPMSASLQPAQNVTGGTCGQVRKRRRGVRSGSPSRA
jgi:hypothetical protein